MDRIKVDDLKLRPEVFAFRLQRRAKLRDAIDATMPDIESAVSDYKLDEYYDRALNLIASGRAARPSSSTASPRKFATSTAATRSARAACWRGAWSRRDARGRGRLAEGGQLGQSFVDVHVDLPKRMRDQSAPMLDGGLSALLFDLDRRGMLEETLVVAVGEFGRSPQRGVSTSGNGNSADGRITGPIATRR